MLPLLMRLLENLKYIWDILLVYNVMLQNTSLTMLGLLKHTHTQTPGWSTGLKSHPPTHRTEISHTHTRARQTEILHSHSLTHTLTLTHTHTHTHPGWSTGLKPEFWLYCSATCPWTSHRAPLRTCAPTYIRKEQCLWFFFKALKWTDVEVSVLNHWAIMLPSTH